MHSISYYKYIMPILILTMAFIAVVMHKICSENLLTYGTRSSKNIAPSFKKSAHNRHFLQFPSNSFLKQNNQISIIQEYYANRKQLLLPFPPCKQNSSQHSSSIFAYPCNSSCQWCSLGVTHTYPFQNSSSCKRTSNGTAECLHCVPYLVIKIVVTYSFWVTMRQKNIT